MFCQACPLLKCDTEDGNKRSNLDNTPHSPVEIDELVLMAIIECGASNSFYSHARSGYKKENSCDEDSHQPLLSVPFSQVILLVGMTPIKSVNKLALSLYVFESLKEFERLKSSLLADQVAMRGELTCSNHSRRLND